MLHCDGRFAKNIDYLFYAQYRCEVKEIKDSLSVSMRKAKGEAVTAGEVKGNIANFIRSDLGCHFLQKIRGSPAFYNKLLYDLLGMIRQLGPCTWFITLSAADLKWPDTIRVIAKQQGRFLSDDDIAKMSWEEGCHLLRSNPVTAANHFEDRVKQFMKLILLNKNLCPLGHILDYKYRVEFQQRGSPHIHMVVWVRDAPTFEINTVEEVAAFVDQHVTCALPTDDDDLKGLLAAVQRHTHSVACKKHGATCRFQFPRPPVRQTTAANPSDPPSKEMEELYLETLAAVQKELNKLEVMEDVSLDILLQHAQVTESVYMEALKWIKTRNGQPVVLLKRKPKEININNYNTTLMNAWQANLDVQFITNVYACVMYVASYISKPEKTLGDVLKGVGASTQHLGAKASMKSIAKKFLTHREVSAQEAVYRLMSLPLSKGSREVVFIATDLPENRTRLMKPIKIIKNLEDDDTDVFQAGYLERYPMRPAIVEDMCLAEFVSKYRYTSRASPKADSDSDTNEDQHVAKDNDAPSSLKLSSGAGYMSRRANPAIIRSHQWSLQKQAEQYYHGLLVLYVPWRDESKDLLAGSYRECWEIKAETVKQNRAQFEKHAEDVEAAVSYLEESGPPEDSWQVLAPQTEQGRMEDNAEGVQVEENVHSAYDTSSENVAASDLGIMQYQYEHVTENVSTPDWQQMVLSLNTRQYEVHQFIVEWCSKLLLVHRGLAKPDPFHLFLTGGAGVGKSHLVRTIVQTVNRLFSRNNQSDETHVLVTAPTGAAAYNIAGHTLHSTFLLPVHTHKSDDYMPLSSEKLAVLKQNIGSMKLLVIDEISMVGPDTLLTIHRRLCDVMGNEEHFGGVSILAVGDLLQLPPVAQKPVFDVPNDEMAALFGSLWKNLFQIIELTEIQRQKNDHLFAALLNRVRVGDHTEEDMLTLKSRQIKPDADYYPSDATHVFPFNRQVDKHNRDMMQRLHGQKITIHAVDSKKDDQTGQIETSAFKETAGGLPTTLTLAINAKVMLTKNLDVQDGLVNSAIGVVLGFYPNPPEQEDHAYRPKYVLVQFNESRVGRNRRKNNPQEFPNDATPIPMIETPIRMGKYSKGTWKRTQFPLALAWAVTIHKEQGKTEDTLVLSCEGSFKAGQFYTAISCTKTLEGLSILHEVSRNKVKTNLQSVKEIERMRKTCPFSVSVPMSFLHSTETHLKIVSQNVNSLYAHEQCVTKQGFLQNAHVVCFQETWLKPQDPAPLYDTHSSIRKDGCTDQGSRKGGLLMYIHHDFRVLYSTSQVDVAIENQLAIICPKGDPELRVCVISLYRNPRLPVKVCLRIELTYQLSNFSF